MTSHRRAAQLPPWVWSSLPVVVILAGLVVRNVHFDAAAPQRPSASTPVEASLPARRALLTEHHPLTEVQPTAPLVLPTASPDPAAEAAKIGGAFWTADTCEFVVGGVPQPCEGYILSSQGVTGVRLQLVSHSPSWLTLQATTQYESTENVRNVWNFDPSMLQGVSHTDGIDSGPMMSILGNCGIVPSGDHRNMTCTLWMPETGSPASLKIIRAKEFISGSR